MELSDHDIDYLNLRDAKPGDKVTFEAMVQTVSVDVIDVTGYGGKHEVLHGETRMTLTLYNAEKEH